PLVSRSPGRKPCVAGAKQNRADRPSPPHRPGAGRAMPPPKRLPPANAPPRPSPSRSRCACWNDGRIFGVRSKTNSGSFLATAKVDDDYMRRQMKVRPATFDDLPGILKIYNE